MAHKPTDILTYEKLLRAKDFIDTNYTLPVSLDLIAVQACMSPYHFLRMFKKVFYMTPHRYLTEKRIDKAKILLKESDLSVTEICFEIGFESVGSFCSMFHRHAGYSPAVYRAKVFKFFRLGFAYPDLRIPSCFLKKYSPVKPAA